MKPLTIGLSTGCFYNRPILSVLYEIRDGGFDCIEVCSFPAHLNYHNRDDVARAGEKIRSLGIRPVSFHAPFADKIDITALEMFEHVLGQDLVEVALGQHGQRTDIGQQIGLVDLLEIDVQVYVATIEATAEVHSLGKVAGRNSGF